MVEDVHTVRKLSSPGFVHRLSSEKGSKALGLPGSPAAHPSSAEPVDHSSLGYTKGKRG